MSRVLLSVNPLSACELGPKEASRHKQLYGSGPRTQDHRCSNVPLNTEPSDPEPHRAHPSAMAGKPEATLMTGRDDVSSFEWIDGPAQPATG